MLNLDQNEEQTPGLLLSCSQNKMPQETCIPWQRRIIQQHTGRPLQKSEGKKNPLSNIPCTFLVGEGYSYSISLYWQHVYNFNNGDYSVTSFFNFSQTTVQKTPSTGILKHDNATKLIIAVFKVESDRTEATQPSKKTALFFFFFFFKKLIWEHLVSLWMSLRPWKVF